MRAVILAWPHDTVWKDALWDRLSSCRGPRRTSGGPARRRMRHGTRRAWPEPEAPRSRASGGPPLGAGSELLQQASRRAQGTLFHLDLDQGPAAAGRGAGRPDGLAVAFQERGLEGRIPDDAALIAARPGELGRVELEPHLQLHRPLAECRHPAAKVTQDMDFARGLKPSPYCDSFLAR